MINSIVKRIQGWVKIKGDTDGTNIGNVGDALKMNITNVIETKDSSNDKAAFGALAIAELSPYSVLDPLRGFDWRSHEKFTSGTGALSEIADSGTSKEFKVSSGTSVGGYGVYRSKRSLGYLAGIGSLGRFTARFSSPVALTIQRAGLQNIGNELAFGYEGTSFGIMYKRSARPEIRTLTITTASNQATNITVTLNGVGFTVPVTNGSAQVNAEEIASFTGYGAWAAYANGSTVIFQAQTVGALNGTYSAVPNSGNFVGSFTQSKAGATGTETFITQANWNENTLLSGDFILDPTKGNVYQVQLQYLGYGAIRFFVESPVTGSFILVHTIKYANSFTEPSLDNPDFKIGIIVASTGSTTNMSVHSGSMALFHETSSRIPIETDSHLFTRSGVGTTITSLLALRKTAINESGELALYDIRVVQMSMANEATKPVEYFLLLNPTFTTTQVWNFHSGSRNIQFSVAGGTVTRNTLGGELFVIGVPKTGNVQIDLDKLGIRLSNDDILVLAARSTSGTVEATGSLVWGEE